MKRLAALQRRRVALRAQIASTRATAVESTADIKGRLDAVALAFSVARLAGSISPRMRKGLLAALAVAAAVRTFMRARSQDGTRD